MKANYSSRGYQIYGDVDNVAKDPTAIREIISRQGLDIVLEVIADNVAESRQKFNLNEKEMDAVVNSIRMSLAELISERI